MSFSPKYNMMKPMNALRTLTISCIYLVLIGTPLFSTEVTQFLYHIYRYNPTVDSQRVVLDKQLEKIKESRSIYDPVFRATLIRQEDIDKYVAQVDETIVDETLTEQFGVSQKWGWGTEWSLSLQSRQQQNVPRPYSSNFSFDLKQPLLKNFGSASNISIQNSELEYERLTYAFNQFLGDFLERALAKYAAYFLASKKCDLYQQEIDLATHLLKRSQKKKQLNLSGEIDYLEAKIQLEKANDSYYSTLAEKELLLAELNQLATANYDTIGLSDFEIKIPSGNLTNPEIEGLLINSQKTALAIVHAQNQALPQLDLNGSLSYNRSKNTFVDSLQFEDPSFIVSVSSTLPWGNNQAQAKLKTHQLSMQDITRQITQKKQELRISIRNARQNIQLKQSRIQRIQSIQALSEKKVLLSKKRFELGLAPIEEVFSAKTEQTQTTIQYQEALIDVIKAKFELLTLLGPIDHYLFNTQKGLSP